uniref:NADH dehydrogenase subunit 4l n=1 Tax=Galerucella birmanica TaxID=409921 RepID=UPI0021B5BA71|nr:NADH dehydrogenase subunit 4l [Galerucella birmanica]UVV35481.1 NADH dehydrogenase subunit 4l [Galerucella birmanica]
MLSIMFFSGALSFVLNRKHLLMMLLSLEFIVVSLYFFIIYMFKKHKLWMFFFQMIYLTMSVCEGALGLSMLILMVRMHGNDYITTFSFLW